MALYREPTQRPRRTAALVGQLVVIMSLTFVYLLAEPKEAEWGASHRANATLAARALERQLAHSLSATRALTTLVRQSDGAVGLNDFRTINDQYGHHAGDRMLQEVGCRLSACLRAADTVARLGGDEFAIVVDGFGDAMQLDHVVAKLEQALSRRFEFDGTSVTLVVSIGSSIFPRDGANVSALLKHADVAMYSVKRPSATRGE